MDLKTILEGVIDFMLANPTSDAAAGGGFAVAYLGIAQEDVTGFFSAVGSEVVAVGMVPSPGGWEAIRDKSNQLGEVAAKAFIGVVVKAGGLAARPEIQIIVLRNQLAQLRPGIDTYEAKVATANAAITAETDANIIEVLEDGRGVNVAASAALTRTRDMLQSQLDTLTNL